MIHTADLRGLAEAAGLGSASIVFEAVGQSGQGASLRPEQRIYPASMIKLPIATALALRCEHGPLSYDGEVKVSEGNLTANDAPSPFVPDSWATLRDLSRAMLSASDNVATNVLIDVLARATIGPDVAAFGLTATAVHRKLSGSLPLIEDPEATGRNVHPAADAALLLHAIDRRRSAGLRNVYAALEEQIWNDKLSRGWNPGDRFAHKTGDTDECSHDGGILALEDGRRFVIVVYTELPSNPGTDAKFAAFAQALRPLL